MIDEKKIEEAARKYAFDKYDSTDDEVEETYTVELQMAFEAGINWFLDNLLHNASEEPEQESHKDLYILYEYNIYGEKRGFGTYNYLGFAEWEKIIRINRITRWLYIEDLLKGASNG